VVQKQAGCPSRSLTSTGPMNRMLVEQLNNTSLHTTLLKLSYTYNNTGTVSSVIGMINGGTVNEQYRYDPLQRLTNATVTSSGTYNRIWYAYDGVGNRLKQSLNGTVTSYLYTLSNNELSSSSAPGTGTSYSYDGIGNLVSKTTGSLTWTYTWDTAKRLLKAGNGTTQGMYAYDGEGRMLESKEGSANIYFAYAGSGILWQNGTDFVYAKGMKVSWIGVSSLNTPRYYHTDQLGSVRLTTRYDATVEFTDNYQPFGQDNGKSIGFQRPPPFEFQGMPLSTRTGFYYDYQRWYDPKVGRFISRDSKPGRLSVPQSLNLYSFVMDCPCSGTDPTGEIPIPLRDDLFYGTGSGDDWGQSATTSSTSSRIIPQVPGEMRSSLSVRLDPIDWLAAHNQPGPWSPQEAQAIIDKGVELANSFKAQNAYDQCKNTATSFIAAGLLTVVSGSTFTLLFIGAAAFFPPAEVAAPFVEAGVLIVGTAFVLTGAIYYGVNCHYPA